jgi:hypothetical protein
VSDKSHAGIDVQVPTWVAGDGWLVHWPFITGWKVPSVLPGPRDGVAGARHIGLRSVGKCHFNDRPQTEPTE